MIFKGFLILYFFKKENFKSNTEEIDRLSGVSVESQSQNTVCAEQTGKNNYRG